MIEVTAAALAAHPFLHGMSRDQLTVLATAASDVTFSARHRLFADGGNATRFWLIQSGRVSLDLHIPGEGPAVIGTVGLGDLLGWSWLVPPYTWAFGAVAATRVEAFEFDAPAVRDHCAADPSLGYELTRRMTRVLAKRLQATRLRLTTHPDRPTNLWGSFCR
ncbi:MAG TPA: Crp/Fnr family transcriptional regulator [Streptosporangiaceae bacterium]